MKAIVQTKYGLRRLQLTDIPGPVPGEHQVLVRVHAAALNYAVMFRASGKPLLARLMTGSLLKPKPWTPGGELSGRVEAVGAKVRLFKPGDEVFGDTCTCGYGALAELVCADENALAAKPAGLSFEEAAGVPQSALVALQGLRAGGIDKGKKVLVHGASGGIGTFAVQIAKYFGAEVTGVCGAGNLDLVRSLGADHVIDYARESATDQAEAYDLILSIRGTLPAHRYIRALRQGGTYVMAGGSLLRYVLTSFQESRLSAGSAGKTMVRLVYSPNAEDLLFMKGLIEAGKVRPVIDKVFPLCQTAAAFRHLGRGHARGRVVVRTIDTGGD
jgi:NADPH:quinone reductase-like Zn-dependent oxidoreductase